MDGNKYTWPAHDHSRPAFPERALVWVRAW